MSWTSLAGPGAALAAAGVLGTSDFLGGLLARRHRAIVVVAWSHAVSFLVLCAVVLATGLPAAGAWVGYAVLAGVASSVGLIAFYAALAGGTMGVVSPVAALGVVIPVLLAVGEGERPRAVQVAGIGVALVGAVLASGPELRHEERVRARAVLLAALAGVCFGVMMWGIVKGSETSSVATMWGMRATSTAGYAAAAVVARSLGRVRARDLAAMGGLGLLDTSGNFLLALSTQLGLVSVGVVLSSLYPVATVALAAAVLRERVRGVQLVGILAALAGVVLVNWP